MWNGDYRFVLRQVNQQGLQDPLSEHVLGAFWSLLNPIIMMSVLTFIFTKIFPNNVENFPVFVLCGLVPF